MLAEMTKMKAREVLRDMLKEQECMVAKFIVDNPDADMTKLLLVSFYDVQEPHKHVIELRYKEHKSET